MYAGCVHWPFQWGETTGLLAGGGVLAAGAVEIAVRVARLRSAS